MSEDQDTSGSEPTAGPPGPVSLPRGESKSISEQEALAQQRLGEPATEDLLHEVGALYERIANTMSTRTELAERGMDLLSEARNLLLMGRVSNFSGAERIVNEVKLILSRAERCRKWSKSYGSGLLFYELALFVALVAALLFDRHIAYWLSVATGAYDAAKGVGQRATATSAIFPAWHTMIWGGIGGIVDALYSLHWHVAEVRDFDKHYTLSYIVQPLMGVILGGLIYLVIVTRVLALLPVSGQAGDVRATTLAVHWFPSLLACLASFRQKFVYGLLDNIMKAVGRQPANSSSTAG